MLRLPRKLARRTSKVACPYPAAQCATCVTCSPIFAQAICPALSSRSEVLPGQVLQRHPQSRLRRPFQKEARERLAVLTPILRYFVANLDWSVRSDLARTQRNGRPLYWSYLCGTQREKITNKTNADVACPSCMLRIVQLANLTTHLSETTTH